MKEEKKSFFEVLAETIVDKRKLLFFIYILAIIFSIFSMGWVQVENDLTAYLDDDTKTRKGLDVMEKNFVTLGVADVMLSNISFDDAENVKGKIEKVKGVTSVALENDDEFYKDSCAY